MPVNSIVGIGKVLGLLSIDIYDWRVVCSECLTLICYCGGASEFYFDF